MDKKALVYLAFLSNKQRNLIRFRQCLSLSEAISVGKELISELREEDRDWIDKNWDYLDEHPEIEIITIWDDVYPELLKQIYDPPIVLFCVGDVGLLSWKDIIAIVGSRKATVYGERIAYELAMELAERGAVVVSGLAIGIDTLAHRGVLSVEGRTIAVLGSGLAKISPKWNINLFNKIVSNFGLVVSEFLPYVQASKYSFPKRNRIIAGLSRAVIVVEAARRSGALITARCAMENGRDVFAVPGPITSAVSYGTNKLISDGAFVVCSIEDLLIELGLLGSSELLALRGAVDLELEGLDKDEKQIIELIRRYNSVTLDILVDVADCDYLYLMQKISGLELKGIIRREGNLLCLR